MMLLNNKSGVKESSKMIAAERFLYVQNDSVDFDHMEER
jgi:hypothetical protein